jgi:hypothetical protein
MANEGRLPAAKFPLRFASGDQLAWKISAQPAADVLMVKLVKKLKNCASLCKAPPDPPQRLALSVSICNMHARRTSGTCVLVSSNCTVVVMGFNICHRKAKGSHSPKCIHLCDRNSTMIATTKMVIHACMYVYFTIPRIGQ